MSKHKYTDEEFINAVNVSCSYANVCRLLGLPVSGGNYTLVKSKIRKLNLDISHFTFGNWNKGLTSFDNSSIKRKSIDVYLTKDSYITSGKLRKKLLSEGIKEHKCECCGNILWFGLPIPLELHHKNGDHFDNRLENLQLLCPNYHALTDSHINDEDIKNMVSYGCIDELKVNNFFGTPLTEKIKNRQKRKERRIKDKVKRHCLYCGKQLNHDEEKFCSKKCEYEYKRIRPEKEVLINDFKELKTFTMVGKKYGVSDNVVRKWCKKYEIMDIIKNT